MSFTFDACRPSLPRRRRTSPAEPLSDVREDYSIRKQTASVIFSVLPLAIQSRIPPILSRPTTPTSSACGDRTWKSSPSSGTATPYAESDAVVGDNYGLVAFESSLDVGPVRHRAPASGVDWRCGRPGLELLISSIDESKNAAVVRPGQMPPPDAAFERRAYLDGVSYLLRGLPQDMDDTEVAVLRKALPPSVAEGDLLRRQLVYPKSTTYNATNPSLLHKSLRAAVARAIVWFCILWPYILVFWKWAAAYEKRHRVSEQVMSQAMGVLSACGKWTAGVYKTFGSTGDGMVGQALADTVAWTVRDMVAGVSEGLHDGLSRAGRASGPQS